MLGTITAWLSSAYGVLGFLPSLLICTTLFMFLSVCFMIWRKHIDELEEFIKEVYKGESVIIDGKKFVSCQFDNCQLIYNGGNFCFDKSFIGEDCRFILKHQVSKNTAILFNAMNSFSGLKKENGTTKLAILDQYGRMMPEQPLYIRNMTTLKEAQKDPKKLEQFIKEREQDTPQGDKDKFDKALESMTKDKEILIFDGENVFPSMWVCPCEFRDYGHEGGWCTARYKHGVILYVGVDVCEKQPTHWKPLPKPPKTNRKERG